jgi:foldase protein PrsA
MGAAFSQDVGRAMLTINGETVTVGEYYRRMEFLEDVGKIVANQFVERPPAFLAVERIVNERLILQLARRQGVAPTPGEIENEYRIRRQDNAEQVDNLLALGVAEADLKAQVAVEMAQFNLMTKGVTITDQQITDHYNNNRFLYSTPATATLRVIVVREAADKLRVESALATRSFADVAREHSVDLSKFDGGSLGEVAIDRLPQNVRNLVSIIETGKHTPWIESQGAFLMYHIDAKSESKQLPLDDRLRRQIRRKMMLDMGRSRNNVKAMMDEMLKTVKVEISSPGLQKLWDAYIRDYQRSLGGQ